MCKLLVADDDKLVQKCVMACLRAVGYEVIGAESGLDALVKCASADGDLSIVFIDITLPKLDGLVAAKKIREINPSTKVILMSGCPDLFLDEVKPDAFLSKPFGGKELFQVLQQVHVDENLPSLVAG